MASILTERPGMWSANTLRQEARRYAIKFTPININTSGLSYKVIDEATPTSDNTQTYLLPPLTQIDGVSTEAARHIIQTRLHKPILSFDDAYTRLNLAIDTWEALIRAGTFPGKRHELLYALHSKTHRSGQQPLFTSNDPAPLPEQTFATRFAWDFELKHFSEHEVHPLDLVRRQLIDMGVTPLPKVNYGDTLTAGMVVAKQKPPTAKGFAFFMLEDGSTRAQLTISPQLWAEHREMLQQARILITQAYASKQGQALSLRAEQIWGLEAPVASRGGYAWG
jgi:error-prone DNA polymerase